ncbi:TrbC/VirB2 family protein [Wolbachia endosymbiont of Ctenocephalides felis wCfeT]|uniref:TrbC/VirB2 family protein n=1 Tax=Wolbachia endosymbiont of Ctenocephalides felis wCfeT TaxID=2732593 RepID=UPI00144826F6|nr:TrbC/VirB2 family protein [Wolbachia endosymbiont of Ctenocephalides felis wCfeT]
MKKILLLIALIFSVAFDATASTADKKSIYENDATFGTICKIITYIQDLGGPIITIVLIGAALLAIFGRMPWPALFALGAFVAVFFGASAVISRVMPKGGVTCSYLKPATTDKT